MKKNLTHLKRDIEKIGDSLSSVTPPGPVNFADCFPPMIKRSETRGQAELVASDQLPTKGLSELRPILEAAGGTVMGQTSGDPIFTDVILPPGWKKTETDHSMWSNLVDARGLKRAAIFYKAAFYDRDARLHACHRLTAGYGTDDWDEHPHKVFCEIKSSEKSVWRGKVVSERSDEKMKEQYQQARATRAPHDGPAWRTVSDQCRIDACEKLKAAFPDCEKIDAYWDLDDTAIIAALGPSLSSTPVGETYTFHTTVWKREHDDINSDRQPSYSTRVNGRYFPGVRCDYFQRRAPRWVVDYSGDWKTKVFPDDATAIAWWNVRGRELLARHEKVTLTITLGKRVVHKEDEGHCS